MLFLIGLLLAGVVLPVSAQETEPSTGILVVQMSPGIRDSISGLQINYRQLSHDFLIGYDGPLPASGLPEAPLGFNLVMECIPWVEVEPTVGYFPYISEESGISGVSQQGQMVGNDCLLYFGKTEVNGWPVDLEGLPFDTLLERAQSYLEHAVRYETSRGINLYVIKEPAYPTTDPFDLTRSQWLKLVKLACQTIRQLAPQARIVIEVIPQYLPDIGYKPYTFLNDLIREGAGFDGIMLVFSRPIATYVSNSGYPHVNWVSGQVAVYSDLGKQMFVRFSGIPLIGVESDRQVWLEEMYLALYGKQTVVGIYWDEVLLYPARLFDVAWPAKPAQSPASAGITAPMLSFISDRTSSGVVKTDGKGQAIIYGYAGEYEIQVEGLSEVFQAHIFRGQERHLDISLPVAETAVPGMLQSPTDKPQSEVRLVNIIFHIHRDRPGRSIISRVGCGRLGERAQSQGSIHYEGKGMRGSSSVIQSVNEEPKWRPGLTAVPAGFTGSRYWQPFKGSSLVFKPGDVAFMGLGASRLIDQGHKCFWVQSEQHHPRACLSYP